MGNEAFGVREGAGGEFEVCQIVRFRSMSGRLSVITPQEDRSSKPRPRRAPLELSSHISCSHHQWCVKMKPDDLVDPLQNMHM